jgi:hypothetical protein
MNPVAFENACKVVAKHLERHVQLQKCGKVTPYAALYIEPSKRGMMKTSFKINAFCFI